MKPWHLYHCPVVPWKPVERKDFKTGKAARAFGRDTWFGAWVLCKDGDALDKMLAPKLEDKT